MAPKVFISYSWTTQVHRERVKEWADRLLADGVNVILDLYDLKEGQDKYAFMEKMVTDPEVTHVLVLSDKGYADKADARKKGVGTESQIISQEVYDKVEQAKFIPIVCEFSDAETACLPIFLKTRIWIDFSTPEAVNDNWEQLVRLLYGKPLHEKPQVGKPPTFVTEESRAPSTPARSKLSNLRQVILQGKPGLTLYRNEFIEVCLGYADSLRVRQRPPVQQFGEKVLDDCGKLLAVRDLLVDWILMEAEAAPSDEFSEAIIDLLERLRELKVRPAEVKEWNDAWLEAHALFVFETFLYVVAALLKRRAYKVLHEVFTSHYIVSQTESAGGQRFEMFDAFYTHSDTLNPVLAAPGRRLRSPAAELIKRQAGRQDLPFADLIQADLLVLLMAFISPNARWYPQLMYYAGYTTQFPLFIRATQHKHFRSLATITGVDDANALRAAVSEGYKRLNVGKWHDFTLDRDFAEMLNLEKLDTLK